jgi:hypothetical protein
MLLVCVPVGAMLVPVTPSKLVVHIPSWPTEEGPELAEPTFGGGGGGLIKAVNGLGGLVDEISEDTISIEDVGGVEEL